MKNKIITSIILLTFSQQLFSQHTDSKHHMEDISSIETHQDESYFRTSIALAHTYVPQSTVEGKEILIFPSLGLDFEYWFNHKIGLGLHNDIELVVFEVQDDRGNYIQRQYPLLSTLDLLWSPVQNVSLLVGPGIEFEKHQNYFIFRIGIEGEIPINSRIDVAPILFYDVRKNAYDTFSVGIGFGYHF